MKHRKLKTVIRSVLILIAVYLITSFLVIMTLYEDLFSRKDKNEYHAFFAYEDMDGYDCREVEFGSGVFTLSGRIYNGSGERIVILGHGKDGSGEDMLAEARYFADNGFAAMVFDLAGHGDSNGSSERGVSQAAADMKNAVLFCKKDEQLRDKPIFLYGFGMSGYGATLCAGMESVKAVAAVSAFSSVSEISLEYALANMNIFGFLGYPTIMLYQYLIFGGEIGKTSVDAVNSCDTPVLAINGTDDDTVLISGSALSSKADKMKNGNFRAVTLEGGTHNSLMRSEKAKELLFSFNSEAYALSKQHGGDVPTFLIKNLYEQYDRGEMSELDTEIMDEIRDFFLEAE